MVTKLRKLENDKFIGNKLIKWNLNENILNKQISMTERKTAVTKQVMARNFASNLTLTKLTQCLTILQIIARRGLVSKLMRKVSEFN